MPVVRPVSPSDRHELAALLLDAYAGTIDDEGGTPADALAEIDGFFGRSAMLGPSLAVEDAGRLVAACLVDEFEGAPWIAYVFTAAAHKGRGLGRLAVDRSIAELAALGHREAGLLITDGNTASERIFAAADPV